MISTRNAYFLSLTADPTPEVGAPWPDSFQRAAQLFHDIHTINLDANKCASVHYGNPLGGWIETSLQLGWDQVWCWAQANGLTRLLTAIEENRTKFTCTRAELPNEVLSYFEDTCRFKIKRSRERTDHLYPKWILYSEDSKQRATLTPVQGVDGQIWIRFYVSQIGEGLLSHAQLAELILQPIRFDELCSLALKS